jgi:hypothetical protein
MDRNGGCCNSPMDSVGGCCNSPPPSAMKAGQKAYHPFISFRQFETTKDCFNEEDRNDACKVFLQELDFNARCQSLKKRGRQGGFQSCTCLSILEDPIAQEVVANYMSKFYTKSRTERMLTIMDWIRYTKRGSGIKPMYYLPFFNDDSTSEYHEDERLEVIKLLSVHKVCRSALRIVLDFGRFQWAAAENCVDTCSSPTHALQNRRSNNGKLFDEYIKDDLFRYFSEHELLATPQATRAVRELAGTGLRDGEEGVI